MTNTELPMDYFDYTGLISPPKEITEKESPGPGYRKSRELVSPTRETLERKQNILIKIKPRKRCGNEKMLKIAKKHGKVEKLKMDRENTPNRKQIFYIKYEQREAMNRAQIELKEE